MKKTPHYEVPLSKSRFERRHIESSSTLQKSKHGIANGDIDDRAERTELAYQIHNPSAPCTHEGFQDIIAEADQILAETLSHFKAEGRLSC